MSKLLEKFAKGTKGMLPHPEGLEALTLLPGWAVTSLGAQPLAVLTEDNAKAAMRQLGERRVSLSPAYAKGVLYTVNDVSVLEGKVRVVNGPPAHLPVGEVAVTPFVVNPEVDNPNWRECKMWVGVPTWKITSSNGSHFVYQLEPRFPAGQYAGASFFTWAYKNSLQADAAAYTDVQKQDAASRPPPDYARNTGTCPVCFKKYKLKGMSMVLHGYTRPGYGWLHGSCMGVGFPPYEVSAEGTKFALASVQKQIQHTEKQLRNPPATLPVVVLHGRVLAYTPMVHHALTPTQIDDTHPAWESMLRVMQQKLAFEMRDMERVAQALQNAIAEWEPHPERILP